MLVFDNGANFFGYSAKRVVLIISTVAAACGTVYYLIHRKKLKDEARWKLVGKLSRLLCYPIKSCALLALSRSDCSILGLKQGLICDRTFMVVDKNGEFVTGRTVPKLLWVFPHISGQCLELKAPGMPNIVVDINTIQQNPVIKSRVWGELVDTVDCGDEVAKWLCHLLETQSLRLVYYPDNNPSRGVRPKNQAFPLCTSRDVGALADASAYNLIAQASVDELNDRLETPVLPEQFRPNFVVTGSHPYGEDEWEWIRIGSTVFRNIKPCTRCLFTTVDPKTGSKRDDGEPLATLKSYRTMDNMPNIPHVGAFPVFGIHLALEKAGVVEVGNQVWIRSE